MLFICQNRCRRGSASDIMIAETKRYAGAQARAWVCSERQRRAWSASQQLERLHAAALVLPCQPVSVSTHKCQRLSALVQVTPVGGHTSLRLITQALMAVCRRTTTPSSGRWAGGWRARGPQWTRWIRTCASPWRASGRGPTSACASPVGVGFPWLWPQCACCVASHLNIMSVNTLCCAVRATWKLSRCLILHLLLHTLPCLAAFAAVPVQLVTERGLRSCVAINLSQSCFTQHCCTA